jgi:hypothetical protein
MKTLLYKHAGAKWIATAMAGIAGTALTYAVCHVCTEITTSMNDPGGNGVCSCPNTPACATSYDTLRCVWSPTRDLRIDCTCSNPNTTAYLMSATCTSDDGC